jgi:cysteine desulfurase/selenocysteine lyase
VSLYFYNTREEIDIVVKALQETIDFFGGMME